MDNDHEVRLELMRPAQLTAAREKFPVAYVPLGATEYHGRHLPVGLDGLKAHGLLTRVAKRIGGVVLPTIYHGTGGGHHEFEWTWMVDRDLFIHTLLATLRGLDKSGIRLIVLLSGHLPNEEIYEALIDQFRKLGGTAQVLTLSDADAFPHDQPRRVDHASKWETSYLLALMGETVDLSALKGDEPDTDAPPPADPAEGGWWFIKDPAHPWYGIAGMADNRPTDASKELGESCVQQAVDWISKRVNERMTQIRAGS